jgi:hypothetical protein
MTVELRDLAEVDPAEVRRVVEAAFGQPRPPGWWEWKHRDGPWGPSFGKVAVEDGRILSVRMLMPWLLHGPDGPELGARAVDAATVPAAQGRQLFSLLNEALTTDLTASGCPFIWSTSNLRSRNAYRRLGWTWLDPIPHRWSLLAPGLRRHGTPKEVDVTTIAPVPSGGVHTPWSDRSWQWRMDPRSGMSYVAAELGEAGAVYRVTPGKRRAVVLLATRGDHADVGNLLRAIGRQVQAHFALSVPGSEIETGTRLGMRRGESLISLWTSTAAPHRAPPWSPGFADLERVL